MPFYNYISEDCTVGDFLDSDVDGLHIWIDPDTEDYRQEPLVWQEYHSISDLPETIPCPVTGRQCNRTVLGVRASFIIKGGFLRDKKECKLLSQIHQLDNDDPYGHLREAGEADDKKSQLKRILRRHGNRKVDVSQERVASKQRTSVREVGEERGGKFFLPGKSSTTLQV